MSIKSNTCFNSLIGTNFIKDDCHIESYDIKNNSIQKELINDFLSPKVNSNTGKEDIKYDAFCFDCKMNVNLSETPICKNHNLKYLCDLMKDININLIEKNLNTIIDNYEKVLKYLEEEINNFKRRNNSQIYLAKNLIDAYKSNINNLNFQIISNVKNVIHFNGINPKKFIQFNSPINFGYNILKEFSVYNYVNETISIEKIQKNYEMKFNSKKPINCVILLENERKLIFNIEKKIFLINTKTYKPLQQIESDSKIILMNLMEDKETILISHDRYIEKLRIMNDKLILEDFIKKNVYIDKPGIIINYQNDYAWTNSYNIGFAHKQYFNILDSSYDLYNRYSGGYKARLIKLFKFKDDILFIFIFFSSDHHREYYHKDIKLGSYKKQLSFEEFLDLEELDDEADYHIITADDFNIHCFKPNEVIIFGKISIFIINIFDWSIEEKILISERLIKSSYYLKDNCFLIFFHNIEETLKRYVKDKEYIHFKNDKKNDMSIMKFGDNFCQILFQKFSNFESSKIFYYQNDYRDCKYNVNNINNYFISVKGNIIEFYCIINVNNSLEMKNN